MIEDCNDQSTSFIATGVFCIQEAQFRTAEAGARIEFKTKTPARMTLYYVTILPNQQMKDTGSSWLC